MASESVSPAAESLYVSAPDGMRLHLRAYRPRPNHRLPIVCLPGLTRTEADFETLARYLSSNEAGAHPVYALDSRGRGRSSYDENWQNYDPRIELSDLDAALTALDIGRAVFVGTSRGGILTMLQAAVRPDSVAGAVLNDIGPAIEPRGLMRIKGYVGKIPRPATHAEGAALLRNLFGAQFPNLADDQWLAWSKRSWEQTDTGMVSTYDARLANTLEAISADTIPPTLWEQFDALAQVPVMVIRGALSDILSAETVEAMRARRADIDVFEVIDQGHAPLLDDEVALRRIAGFERCEQARG